MDKVRWLAGSFGVVLTAGLMVGACSDDTETADTSTSTSTSTSTGTGGTGGTATGGGGQGGTTSGSGGQGGLGGLGGAGGQGGSVFTFQCGSAQGGGGQGGAGGQGGTATGGGGQGGASCVTCAEWATTGAEPSSICDDSCDVAEPLAECACVTDCHGPCGGNLCLGAMPSGGCGNCLASNCVDELSACSSDT